jgi:2-polyprenyl-3-methyl-5-hydroxy-6-metoxy-1,4-benzoquinol methylase
MIAPRRSRNAHHFQRLYDASLEPWQFRSSEYERAKYRTTIASLGGEHFRSGFEVGCSIGELTCMLAGYCDALLAVDIVEAPLRAAHSVCAEQPWVRFAQMEVPRQWPDDVFDLIVLSEVLYFLSPEDIIRVADRAADTLEPQGIVLLVNWRGRTDDPCTGDQAAAIFIERVRNWLSPRLQYSEGSAYRLDLLSCR